jgi:hypothetical protein
MKMVGKEVKDDLEHPTHGYKNLRKKLGVWRHKDEEPEEDGKRGKASQRKRGPALAYQFGNTVSSLSTPSLQGTLLTTFNRSS